MAVDFGDVNLPVSKGKRPREEVEGTQREYLKIYETLPCQLLNAYGMAKFPRLSDETVWLGMCEPLKSGAKYMTEYASLDPSRRGVGINRWLQPMIEYCKYQQSDVVRKQNAYIMNEKVYKELYEEIDRILPAMEYCLAPKKAYEKTGGSMLRSASQASSSRSITSKSLEDLDSYALQLFEWLDVTKPSRIRMMIQWQGAGGLPYVCSAHHRATQCFKYHGNTTHNSEKQSKGIVAHEWVAAIKARHQAGSDGIEAEAANDAEHIDFKEKK